MKTQLLVTFFLCSLHHATDADFSFTLNIQSHSTSGTCDTFIAPNCETYFSIFCLRGPRSSASTSTSDCPLGTSGRFDSSSGSRTISSDSAWPGGFQLFIQAFDDDGSLSSSDHLDNIFVNRLLQANTISTAAPYRGSRVTVRMTFSIQCQQDYYGASCIVFCQPRSDDQNGHFSCNLFDGSRDCLADYYGSECTTFCRAASSEQDGFYTCNSADGSRLCNPGYTNPDDFCRENIDDCASEPCVNGGNCTDLVEDFMCACPPGFTGKNCSVEINECFPNNSCPGNSTCIDELDSYSCTCNTGFEGDNCTEITPCDPSPCENGGTCNNDDPFSFVCLCLAGFTGVTCETDTDECQMAGCPDNTACQDEVNGYQCISVSDKISNRQFFSSQENVITVSSASVILLFISFVLIVLIVVVVILTKKRRKYNVSRSVNHIYQSPSHIKFADGSPSPVGDEDTMDRNCMYNDTTFTTQAPGSSPPSPGDLDGSTYRKVNNTLYTTQDGKTDEGGILDLKCVGENEEEGIYSTIAPDANEDRLTITRNVAYGTINGNGALQVKGEVVDNPFYTSVSEAKDPSFIPSSFPPPLPSSAPSPSHYDTPMPSKVEEVSMINDSPAINPSAHAQNETHYENVKENKAAVSSPSPPILPQRNNQSGEAGAAAIYATPTSIIPSTGNSHATPISTPPASDSAYSYATPLFAVGAGALNQHYNKLEHRGTSTRLASQKDSGYQPLFKES